MSRKLAALSVAWLIASAPSVVHAQRPTPPESTTTPAVPWAGTATRRADARVLRALRVAFPRAITRAPESCPNCALDFGETAGVTALRPVEIIARASSAGVAALAVFRIAQPARPRDREEEGGADTPCPDLWLARLSLPPGAREATIDSAFMLEADVCVSEYDTGQDEPTKVRVIVDPSTRGLADPYRVRIVAEPIFHAQQCGCGGVSSAFQELVRVDGGESLRVDTHQEQSGCMPVLDGWVAFVDHDQDGDRDLIVRQRLTSPFSPGGELCDEPRRVATRAAVDAAFDAEQPACVRYVERTVRLWNAETRALGPPQPLPLGNEREQPVSIRGRTPQTPDAGAPR